ncbi:hypothetical protein JX266_008522 [Neoarthrinium moseri]|nr:hypothetical protein JX266_008522 [Neoarthrinium moseri]
MIPGQAERQKSTQQIANRMLPIDEFAFKPPRKAPGWWGPAPSPGGAIELSRAVGSKVPIFANLVSCIFTEGPGGRARASGAQSERAERAAAKKNANPISYTPTPYHQAGFGRLAAAIESSPGIASSEDTGKPFQAIYRRRPQPVKPPARHRHIIHLPPGDLPLGYTAKVMVSKEKKPPKGRSVKERAQDDLVMSTNSSSIVSKRSVERIYYPDEPHFFRFFVKKFQRRSPLINRGYHLRLHVIDVAVRNFLKRPSAKTKVVINLGAGFDVLPWQCLTRYADDCKDVIFVDVDFPDLMTKKRNVVNETAELNSILTNLRHPDDPVLMLQSDQYVQIGCDLRELDRIRLAMEKVVSINDCEFMFVAEVSITYMETQAADSVIQWASSLGQAEFCLLEQILPDGPDHPFAETMLRHFDKLKTSLKSVASYPDLEAQKTRFICRGWPDTHVETLWSAWSSEKYLSSQDRQKLNEVEPFDEWEEFAIFGGHYCVVTARTSQPAAETPRGNVMSLENIPSLHVALQFGDRGKPCHRRFGASMALENSTGDQFIADAFGLGNTSRLKSLDLYRSDRTVRSVNLASTGPPSRMCHSIVDLGIHGNLLVGGRGSPSSPLKDCWLFDKARKSWSQVHDLPTPLYRHAATRLASSGLALVVGGKTGSASVFGDCLIYDPEKGWIECEIKSEPKYTPASGAILVCTGSTSTGSLSEDSTSVIYQGILAGGLLEDGTMATQSFSWELKHSDASGPTITFTPITNSDENGQDTGIPSLLRRYGSSAVLDQQGHLFVIGGIVEDKVIPHELEILLLDITGPQLRLLGAGTADYVSDSATDTIPRPLLIGMSTLQIADGRVLITAGGATCFSMGTYWNKGSYTLKYPHAHQASTQPLEYRNTWIFHETVELADSSVSQLNGKLGSLGLKPSLVTIPRVRLDSPKAFTEVLKAGKPVVIEQANLGCCVQKWTPAHLVNQIGADRKVTVHEATTAKMDFNAKNFSYVTKGFGAFVQELENGGKMYLRALSEEQPADRPANLGEDFPPLAEEFQLPAELLFVTENIHSSVLRMSGPVNMWLHYDVMANIYCQIVGSKRLILFPPTDVTELSFGPGASSSSINVFGELETTSLANTHPHEAVLNPGDVLFLPPLWLHTAAPQSNLGVAVNVFFRNLEGGYSSGRDVYGNRDLAAYEKGRQDVARVVNAFGKVPHDMKEFYVKRLADELLTKLHD